MNRKIETDREVGGCRSGKKWTEVVRSGRKRTEVVRNENIGLYFPTGVPAARRQRPDLRRSSWGLRRSPRDGVTKRSFRSAHAAPPAWRERGERMGVTGRHRAWEGGEGGGGGWEANTKFYHEQRCGSSIIALVDICSPLNERDLGVEVSTTLDRLRAGLTRCTCCVVVI